MHRLQMMQQRASRQLLTLLSPKSTSLLETGNMRTMFQAGRATIITNKMNRYNFSVLGVSETRGGPRQEGRNWQMAQLSSFRAIRKTEQRILLR